MYYNKMVEAMDEGKKESGTITIKKDSLWKYSTLLLIVVVVIGGFFFFRGNGNGGIGTGAVTDTGSTGQQPINAKALIEANDPVLGNADAGVSIIEFSDFECPYCERAYNDALAQFKQSSYFTQGQVNLIYKQFPLNSIHPYAQVAAEASLCADAQGKFWEYHNALFDNQNELTATLQSSGVTGVVSSLKNLAAQIGLNTGEFNSCLDDGKYTSEVNKELAQAASAGGQGTPFFVIVNTETGDATSISGAYPWAQFEAAIQSVQ